MNNGNFNNKLLMIKYIQAIRSTMIANGILIKWKDLKKIAVGY